MKTIYIITFIFLLLTLTTYAHTHQEELKLPIGLLKQLDYQRNLALGVTFIIALLAGMLTFTSPCSFVLLPVYFSILYKEKKKSLEAVCSFIVGLTSAFLLFGIIAGVIGNYFNDYKLYFASLSGFFILIFGIMVLLNKGFSVINKNVSNERKNIFGFIIFGFLFGVGWSPCVGPILSSILFLAANTGSILKSTLLLGTYAMGIAIPLLLLTSGIAKTNLSSLIKNNKVKTFNLFKLKITTTSANIISGLIMIIIGGVMFFFKGTTKIELFISSLTGWVMNGFVGLNEHLREVKFFSSTLASVLGIIIASVVLVFIIYTIVNKGKKERSKRKET